MKKQTRSLLQSDFNYCFLCRTSRNLETHHAMHGTANRKIADDLGLTVRLCRGCHEIVHKYRDIDLKIIEYAQTTFESKFSHEAWMDKFGKNYL